MNPMYFKYFRPAYNNPPANNPPANNPPANNPPADPPADPNNDTDRKFTQADLNRIAAEERRKFQAKQEDQAKKLEALQRQASTTEEQKAQLQQQIDEIRQAHLSDAEKAKLEKERLQKDAEARQKGLESERDQWRQRHHDALLSRELTEAAVGGGAHNPVHISTMLRLMSQVVELKDQEGKPSGQFSVQIKFPFVDPKDKKESQLLLNPKEAVQKMREMPETYGYLFKTEKTGGTGGQNVPGTTLNPTDIKDFETYKKHRPQITGR